MQPKHYEKKNINKKIYIFKHVFKISIINYFHSIYFRWYIDKKQSIFIIMAFAHQDQNKEDMSIQSKIHYTLFHSIEELAESEQELTVACLSSEKAYAPILNSR